MYLKAGSYYFVSHGNKWHNLGRDYVSAMSRYAQLTDNSRPLTLMADVFERYRIEVIPTKAPRTQKDYIRHLRYLQAGLGHLPPGNITSQTVRLYRNERGKSAKIQANRELAVLSAVFAELGEWIGHDSNPVRGVKRFEEKSRTRYVSDRELEAFCDYAGPFWTAYLGFKLLTGLRKGDLLRLRLSDLKDDGIHAYISKSSQNIVIEWTPALRAAVDKIRSLKRPVRGLHLFCRRDGQPYRLNGIGSMWQRKMKAAVTIGVLAEPFWEHDIRAKTGSDMETVEQATELLAHSSSQVTRDSYRRAPVRVKPLK